MGATADYLAIDLGASSGRGMLGSFDGQRLSLREVHRFANGPVNSASGPCWDASALFGEIKRALSLAVRSGASLAGVGVDTWGVDYGLLSSTGELLEPPRHYRNPRTHGLMQEAFHRVPRALLYERTGIQFLEFNTLDQLLADQRAAPTRLKNAAALLFMPDLFHYWLTGVRQTEHTIASTSQMYDPGAGAWAEDIIATLGLPTHILPRIAAPGSPLGPLLRTVADETGAGPVSVIAPASHDTASAVAAAPGTGSDWAYISSGTWSLVGRELPAPVRTPAAMAANFTNERGVEGTIRFHKNIAGLWLLQECQRVWAAQGRVYSFEQLRNLALAAEPHATFVDPDDASFAEFGDMPARIRDFCLRTAQRPPESDGAVARCILESLSLKCGVVTAAWKIPSGRVRTIPTTGGGVHNTLLSKFTADATAREVLAGPVEATAAGNIMTQALAHRRVTSLREIRAVIAASLPPRVYHPKSAAAWHQARTRFVSLLPL